jgi:hypothetical protein
MEHLLTSLQRPVPDGLSRHAARSGSISLLNWLRAQSLCSFDDKLCAAAAEGGQLKALQHLRSAGCSWNEQFIACYAARSGSIEVVEWLRQQQGVQISAVTLAWAAGAGQIAMCEHLRSTGCAWNAHACRSAARVGEVTTLRWSRERGCPWHVSKICVAAATNGYTSILDFVLEQGEVLDAELLTDALNCAGTFNKLRAVQWLRQHGASWPTLLGFSGPHHKLQWSGESLAWARAQGCTSPVAPL